MKVLITGVAGFLGSHLAQRLSTMGHEIVGIDNMIGGYEDNIPQNITFHKADYNCVKSFFSIYPKSTEKYILVKYTRNIRRENPDNCRLIFEESYNLNLLKNKLKMGEVYICN